MDILTLAVVLGYTKKQVEEAKREGFRVQVEQELNDIADRVISRLPDADNEFY